jgi:hypothetical protein
VLRKSFAEVSYSPTSFWSASKAWSCADDGAGSAEAPRRGVTWLVVLGAGGASVGAAPAPSSLVPEVDAAAEAAAAGVAFASVVVVGAFALVDAAADGAAVGVACANTNDEELPMATARSDASGL